MSIRICVPGNPQYLLYLFFFQRGQICCWDLFFPWDGHHYLPTSLRACTAVQMAHALLPRLEMRRFCKPLPWRQRANIGLSVLCSGAELEGSRVFMHWCPLDDLLLQNEESGRERQWKSETVTSKASWDGSPCQLMRGKTGMVSISEKVKHMVRLNSNVLS